MSSQTQFAGLTRMATLMAAATFWLGWGTGAGQAASANALATASAEARVSASASVATVTSTSDTLQLTATLTSASTQAITEVGSFDALTAGNMDHYGSFASIGLNAGDTIGFTIKVTYT